MRGSKKIFLYDTILDRLIEGRYKFGERILVKELGSETGASRQPIMTALSALSADGFVRIIPQVGCEVITPSRRDLSDFFRMFSRLEGLLAELAAERRDAAQLAALKDANALVRNDAKTNGGKRYPELNRAFHKLFHQMANSPLLDSKQRSVFAMSDFFIRQTVGPRPKPSAAAAEHDELINAIERRDAKKARSVAEAHIDDVAEAVLAGASSTGK